MSVKFSVSTFEAWQQSLKCKQTALKTVMLLAARLPIVRWPLLALPGKVWSSSKRLPASLLPPLDGGMFLVMLANYYGASCKSYWLLILPTVLVAMLPGSEWSMILLNAWTCCCVSLVALEAVLKQS